MALKQEIFEQNSTLFEVLDENEVMEIKEIQSSVTAVQTQVDQQKLQLDGLARKVDLNQARNEEQFVNFNTMLIATNTDVDKLKTTTATLSVSVNNLERSVGELETTTQSNFDTIFRRLAITEETSSQNKSEIVTILDKIDDLEHSVESANDEIAELTDSVEDNQTAITTLSGRVTTLADRVTKLENIVQSISPYIQRQTFYRIVYYKTNGSVRNVGFWANGYVRYSMSFQVGTSATANFFTNLTITSVISSYDYSTIPVLKGVPVRLTGSYPTGSNTFESVSGSTAIIYDDNALV
nr:hypothetical protein 3 [Drosophila immigrans Nora virus]